MSVKYFDSESYWFYIEIKKVYYLPSISRKECIPVGGLTKNLGVWIVIFERRKELGLLEIVFKPLDDLGTLEIPTEIRVSNT